MTVVLVVPPGQPVTSEVFSALMTFGDGSKLTDISLQPNQEVSGSVVFGPEGDPGFVVGAIFSTTFQSAGDKVVSIWSTP